MPKNSKKGVDKIDCLWGLVCSLSSVDQQRNNISLFNVINQLTLPEAKIKEQTKNSDSFNINFEHELVLVWRRKLPLNLCSSDLVTDIKVTAIDPSGTRMGEILAPLRFESGKRIMQVRIQNNFFKLSTEGDYVYRVEIIQPGTDKFTQVYEVPYNLQFV